MVSPEYLCDLPSDRGNPEGLSPYEDDPNAFVLILDASPGENGNMATALLIRMH